MINLSVNLACYNAWYISSILIKIYANIYIKNNETKALDNMGKNGNVNFKNLY